MKTLHSLTDSLQPMYGKGHTQRNPKFMFFSNFHIVCRHGLFTVRGVCNLGPLILRVPI